MKRICINQKNYKPQLFEQFKINFDLTTTSSVLNECASVLSHIQLFATSWTVARQALLSMEFSQARILEWVAISYSGGSSLPRYQTLISCVSCIASGFFFFFYHCTTSILVSSSCLYLKIPGIFLQCSTCWRDERRAGNVGKQLSNC